jgi:hypothetical protein
VSIKRGAKEFLLNFDKVRFDTSRPYESRNIVLGDYVVVQQFYPSTIEYGRYSALCMSVSSFLRDSYLKNALPLDKIIKQ